MNPIAQFRKNKSLSHGSVILFKDLFYGTSSAFEKQLLMENVTGKESDNTLDKSEAMKIINTGKRYKTTRKPKHNY